MKKNRLFCLLMTLLMVTLSGCSNFAVNPISYTGIALDTIIKIDIYDSSEEELIEKCVSLCQKYESQLSRTIETSEIAKINNAKGEAVSVSDETLYLINKGIYYSELSHGAFDITIGTVTSLWDFKSEKPVLPDPADIATALSHVDYKNIVIENDTVKLLDPEAKIDLGAIAKGYIADKIKEFLISEGVEHALINLGGNVLAIGNKPDGSSFNIGVQTPFDTQAAPITAISLTDQSAVTSGTYQRYFEYDNQLYHHLLDPSTGYPASNGLNSVTIITDYSVDADALSTTCFILGPEKGMELINQTEHAEAIFITENNELLYSENY